MNVVFKKMKARSARELHLSAHGSKLKRVNGHHHGLIVISADAMTASASYVFLPYSQICIKLKKLLLFLITHQPEVFLNHFSPPFPQMGGKSKKVLSKGWYGPSLFSSYYIDLTKKLAIAKVLSSAKMSC